MPHEPVLLNEVISILELESGDVVLDGTIGSGGHAAAILKRIGPSGILIGLDQDASALNRVEEKLKQFKSQIILKQLNFRYLDQALSEIKISSVNAVLLDVGVSQDQLEEALRGFSFRLEGPLDMRMDPRAKTSAASLVAECSEEELQQIFYKYGEERRARQIARWIVREREKKQIHTTIQLAELIAKRVPARIRFGRIHPATRIFQALRIAVNDELGALADGVEKGIQVLKPDGRFAVITFHSLEDRIVKRAFLKKAAAGEVKILTKRPVVPTACEIERNSRSRSAKLRVIRKLESSNAKT